MRAARLAVFAAALGSMACGKQTPADTAPDSGPVLDGAAEETPDAGDAEVAEVAPLPEVPIDPKILAGIKGKDAILGTHWRPVGGPMVAPEAEATVTAVGGTIYLSTVRGLRKSTGTGWSDVDPRPCRFAPSANGTLLCVRTATFDRFDGTTWTTHACPDGVCTTANWLVETGTGAFVHFGSVIKRRAPGSTVWTTMTGPSCDFAGTYPPARLSAAGDRVALGPCYSLDDGVTFTKMPGTAANTAATAAGILSTNADTDGVSLHTPTGVTVTLPTGAKIVASSDTRVVTWTTAYPFAGTLRVSTDGGRTWTVRTSPIPVDPPSFSVSSKLLLISNDVWFSTDDGATFSQLLVPRVPAAVYGAYREGTKGEIFTADSGWVGLRIHRSTDDGATWAPVPFDYRPRIEEGGDYRLLLFASPGGHVFAGSAKSFARFDDKTLSFLDEGTFRGEEVMSAAAGKLFLANSRRFSTDDGQTWSTTGASSSYRLGGIDAVGVAWSHQIGIFGTAAAIERSADGVTWLPTSAFAGTLFGVAADRTLYGFCCSSRELMRSTDRGLTWVPLPVRDYDRPMLLPLGASSTLVFVVDKGTSFTVQMSNDGATTFVDRTLDLPGRPSSFFAGNGHVWATVPALGMFELVP